MIDTIKFIKDNVPLVACTLGFAIIGYLGYHMIRWIIEKCQQTEKIDEVAQRHLSTPPSKPVKPILNASQLEIPKGEINTGQGEYIVFDPLKGEVNQETFEQVYEILNDHAPAALGTAELYEKRYESIRSKVKKIDNSLEVCFIPRTLYELIFIRKCIREDVKNKYVCSAVSPEQHKIDGKDLLDKRIQKKCWHLCYFETAGDNDHPGVRNVAYRLNRVIIKALSPKAGGFTYSDLCQFTEKEIKFLQEYKKTDDGKRPASCDWNYPGPSLNFKTEYTGGSIKPMGIRDEKDAQIIRNAIAVECSVLARKFIFLFRGANFEEDNLMGKLDKKGAMSLSYGAGLFSGSIYDGGATAFYYMRNKLNGFVIPISIDQLNSTPFYIPPKNALSQLFGAKELFHGRSKAWKDFDLEKMEGINYSSDQPSRDHLESQFTKEELIAQFNKYMEQAIHLK